MNILTGPQWANGCDECKFGIAMDAPMPRNGMTLAEVRRMQYREGIIVFCECEAGQAYQRLVMSEPQPAAKSTPVAPARPAKPSIHEMSAESVEELREVYA